MAGSVIVVEDEQRVARVIVTILERAGYDVTVAASLAEALLALAGRSYDVLVADLILPDGDGLAFAEAFGTSHARPSPFRSRNGDEQPRRERRLGGSGLTA